MNKQERDYAAKRVEQVFQNKADLLGNRPMYARMTKDEMVAHIKSSKAVLKSANISENYGEGTTIVAKFEFPPRTKAEIDKLAKDTAAWEAKYTSLNKQKTEILDEIMLGDSQRALDLLKSFENSK